MRKNAFIIAEYNPFHNGHCYHIEKTREAGAENVICLMSGNFVQRGTPAIFDKEIRAKSAILSGADLVLELPLKYALSGAGEFADGAVKTLIATGLKGTLSFGASSDSETLLHTAKLLSGQDVLRNIENAGRDTGKNYASAADEILKESGDNGDVLKDANNILAVEYIKSIRNNQADVDFYRVKRAGNEHDSSVPGENTASAKWLRSRLRDNNDRELTAILHRYCPKIPADMYGDALLQGNIVKDYTRLDVAVLSVLSGCSPEYLRQINGVNQGLENRIYKAVRDAIGFMELCDAVKTKRFTHSRIRRSVLSAVLGITKEDIMMMPSYLRVLGCNQRGKKILNEMTISASLPIVTNISQAPLCHDRELDCKAYKLYELCKQKPKYGNPEYLVKPFVLQ